MLFLESENPDKDIHLYINSPGGSVSAGLSIFDTMQFIKPDVSTMCMGMAASMGSFLLMAGAKGKRMRAAELAHHDPPAVGRRAGPGDRHRDPRARDPEDARAAQPIYAERTGQPIEKIRADMERDFFMDPEEAKAYGLIDQVLSKRDAPPTPQPGKRAKCRQTRRPWAAATTRRSGPFSE